MMPWLRVAASALALTLALSAVAQEVAEEPLQVVGAAESAELARVLAQPVPAGAAVEALRRHFIAKADAARRLGDLAQSERVLRAAMEALPLDTRFPNDLAWIMRDAGRPDEADRLFLMAVTLAARPADRLFYETNRLLLQIARGSDGALAELARIRQAAMDALATLPPSVDRVTLLRALGRLAGLEADWQGRRALLSEQLASRAESERRHREALDAAEALPARPRSSIAQAANGLAIAQRERAAALMRMGRYVEVEALLVQHVDFIQRYEVPGTTAAAAHHSVASLRLWQGEFAESERQLRLSLQALDALRVPHTHPSHVSRRRDLLAVLWARGQFAEARRELDALDQELRDAKAPPARGSMPFERGVVWLSSGREQDAAGQFAELAARNLRALGPAHFYTAQAQGLQGVALWRAGRPAERERASDLLKDAVLNFTAPGNADFLDDANLRRPVRTLIYTAYLEAMAQRGGLQAMVAMGIADRLLAGSTSQAIADAALRASANDPALADLVRQEQDARNQLLSLQQSLQVSEGGDARADDAGSARTRSRIGELELLRQQLQERVRARYPGYDRLLRPGTVNPTEVAQRLKRDEALLLAMPTEQALYLWLVTADELPVFVRVNLGARALEELVSRLRQGLDLGLSGGRKPRFDPATSHELYRQVLGPLEKPLKGRKHLVVAASGALARVPFATLLTGPSSAEPLPWLIRQMAISQVPTVSAWLALRQMPSSQPAPEAMLAWADALYARAAAPAPAAKAGARQLVTQRKSPASAAQLLPEPAGLRFDELPPLPETRDEVTAIASALRANPDTDLLLGARATRDSVLAANRSGQLARKRVLVFATHGLVAGDLPGLKQPALAMSAIEGQRDPLGALIGLDDVLGLKLNADWVVLSACNTAAADGRAEEALSGLARGFLYAGSRSLLVTHWAVETESAKLLTTGTFVHQAANPTASKAESLRQAMLGLLNHASYGHPAYWAPFALVGDGAR